VEAIAVKFAIVAWLIAAAVLLPVCVLIFRWGAQRKRAMLNQVIAARLREQLLRSVDYGKRKFKAALWLLAITALCVSLARPLFGYREIKVERPGVDLMLALDISKSMLAEDVGQSNRLHAAKFAILRLLERPSGDRVGLIAFAGEPSLMAPMTLDHQAVVRSVEALTTTAISKPGSDIAAALKLALQSFDPKQQSGKAIVLLTDGEELQGDAIVAAREVAGKGAAIFTVGVGSPTGARIADRRNERPDRPQLEVRYAKNEFGQEVVSRLNERVLQQVAVSGRGFYAPLGENAAGLILVSERGLAPLARGTEVRQSKEMREFFQIPLGFCVLLLLWEMLVNERRKVQKVTTV
jgi:Ca-activated chloride channel homolog